MVTVKADCELIDRNVNAIQRYGGLMVISLDSRTSVLGSRPGRGCCVVFLGKPLSIQEYKMGTGELQKSPGITVPFNNTRTLKFKTQHKIAFFAAVNHQITTTTNGP